MEKEKSPLDKCSPFWYAVGGIFATPLLVATLLVGAVMFAALWPAIPFLLYFQRREEREAALKEIVRNALAKARVEIEV